MADKTWNKNVRFNTNSESAMQAWSLLHSDEVENGFKSQNEFIICASNDYYERYMKKKDDPYLAYHVTGISKAAERCRKQGSCLHTADDSWTQMISSMKL